MNAYIILCRSGVERKHQNHWINGLISRKRTNHHTPEIDENSFMHLSRKSKALSPLGLIRELQSQEHVILIRNSSGPGCNVIGEVMVSKPERCANATR